MSRTSNPNLVIQRLWSEPPRYGSFFVFCRHPGGCYSRTFPSPSAGILIKTSEPRRRRSKVSAGHTYET
jgi:hypothetical protein